MFISIRNFPDKQLLPLCPPSQSKLGGRYFCRRSCDDFSIVSRAAEEFNTQPVNILENNHEGRLPLSYCGMEVSGSIAVTALKRAEDGSGWVVRAVETAGTPAKTSISLSAFGRKIESDFGPFEVKTFLVADDGSEREVLLTEFDI